MATRRLVAGAILAVPIDKSKSVDSKQDKSQCVAFVSTL